MRKNTYYYPLGLGYIPTQEEMVDVDKASPEDIQNEIQILKLENKSVEFLRREVAELSLENKLLSKELTEFRKKHKADTIQLLKLIKSELRPHLAHGLVSKIFEETLKNAPAINGSLGGNARKKINHEYQLRQEIIEKAKLAIQSGELTRHKAVWIKNILKESKYKGLSPDTLYREIKLKN